VDAPFNFRLAAFEHFAEGLILENGSNMVLEPWQRDILADYFGGCRETLLLLPKKQGKSSLLAAIALHHALEVDNAEFIIAAASRDQAGILFRQAVGFVRRTPELQEHFSVKEGYREIRCTRDHGRIRVIASDANTADGALPTGVAADELHRWKSSELYTVLRSGLMPRNGQMLGISTASDDPDGMLGRMRAKAMEHLVRAEGAYKYCKSPDGQFVLHEYSLADDADFSDMSLVVTANPASWMTEEVLREIYDSPSTEPWAFARFHCNAWVAGENAALDPVSWKACGRGTGLEPGEPCFVGIDLGWRRDSTAIVPYVLDKADDLDVYGIPTVIPAPNDGSSTSYRVVIEAIRDIHRRNPIDAIVIDPNTEANILLQTLAEDADLGRIEIIEHSQDPSPMSTASMGFAEAVRAGKVVHPDDAEYTKHVLNAAAKVVTGERWRFVKSKTSKKIDCLIAAAMVRSKAREQRRRPRLDADEFVVFAA
jgi:phage terminase large subunit-like protein